MSSTRATTKRPSRTSRSSIARASASEPSAARRAATSASSATRPTSRSMPKATCSSRIRSMRESRNSTTTASSSPRIGKAGSNWGEFDKPKGVALDTFGNMYVVDTSWSNVQIFNPKGEILLFFGGRGPVPGMMKNPLSIAIDKNNRIYVGDYLNHRIGVYQLVNTTAARQLHQAGRAESDGAEGRCRRARRSSREGLASCRSHPHDPAPSTRRRPAIAAVAAAGACCWRRPSPTSRRVQRTRRHQVRAAVGRHG